jgi:hypothetical protein
MDYSLQNDPMAVCKCRKSGNPLQNSVPWYYWLTAHALLHGACVGVVFRWVGFDWHVVVAFGLAETVIHWLIDFGKCEKLYSIHVDQAFHVLCKLAWWGAVVGGMLQSLGL